MDASVARRLSERHPEAVIRRQLEWLGMRTATKSRAGLLRRAIEGDWPIPRNATIQEKEGLTIAISTPPYLEWLAVEEKEYRRNFPEDYSRFTAKRARRRDDLRGERDDKRRFLLLADHDRPERRLLDFQEFLVLPNLRQWERSIIQEK